MIHEVTSRVAMPMIRIRPVPGDGLTYYEAIVSDINVFDSTKLDKANPFVRRRWRKR
jgi:hypothetical protein